MTISPTEHVVLVTENDEEIGIADKATIHTDTTPLHRGFSLFLFNDRGELLLQQRTQQKITWPGIWSNSVCGHPMQGESPIAAAQRRLDFELGITLAQAAIHMILPKYQYRYEHHGVVEHEICPVMAAFANVTPKPNPSEVAHTRWINWPSFLDEISRPSQYSEWCIEEANLLNDNSTFRQLYSDFCKPENKDAAYHA